MRLKSSAMIFEKLLFGLSVIILRLCPFNVVVVGYAVCESFDAVAMISGSVALDPVAWK